MVDQTRTQNKVPAVGAALVTLPEMPVEFATPLREVEVVVIGRYRELGLLDEGSEIVIVREDLCKELGLEVNKKRRMTMQTANGGKEEMQGCVEYLELEVRGVKTYAHAFVVQSAPYWLLLGRLWQKGVKLGKIERADGSVEVEISDPGEGGKQVVVPMRKRRGERLKSSMLAVEERGRSERERFKIDEEPDGSDCGKEAFDGISKGEKTAINEGGDILCEEDVVLEKSEEETKSKGVASRLIKEREIEVLNVEKSMQRNEDIVLGRVMGESGQQGVKREKNGVVGNGVWAAVQRVEEKKMGIQDPGEDVRHDKDVILGRKGERDRLRDTEEVRQQGVEDKGTKKRDEERSKVRDGQEMSEMLGSLTKKGGQRCPQHIKMSLQVAKELIKGRSCRSSTKNSRNCVDISSVQRSVEWECRGYIPTIKRRSVSSGSSLSEGTVNGNRDHGRTDSGTEGTLTSSTKVGKGV